MADVVLKKYIMMGDTTITRYGFSSFYFLKYKTNKGQRGWRISFSHARELTYLILLTILNGGETI